MAEVTNFSEFISKWTVGPFVHGASMLVLVFGRWTRRRGDDFQTGI